MTSVRFVPFAVLDAKGHIVREGMCAEHDVQAQATNVGEVACSPAHATPAVAQDGEMLYSYSAVRAQRYPDIRDQLDAIWKFFATQDGLPAELQAMSDLVASVKQQVPKDNAKYIRDASTGEFTKK